MFGGDREKRDDLYMRQTQIRDKNVSFLFWVPVLVHMGFKIVYKFSTVLGIEGCNALTSGSYDFLFSSISLSWVCKSNKSTSCFDSLLFTVTLRAIHAHIHTFIIHSGRTTCFVDILNVEAARCYTRTNRTREKKGNRCLRSLHSPVQLVFWLRHLYNSMSCS